MQWLPAGPVDPTGGPAPRRWWPRPVLRLDPQRRRSATLSNVDWRMEGSVVVARGESPDSMPPYEGATAFVGCRTRYSGRSPRLRSWTIGACPFERPGYVDELARLLVWTALKNKVVELYATSLSRPVAGQLGRGSCHHPDPRMRIDIFPDNPAAPPDIDQREFVSVYLTIADRRRRSVRQDKTAFHSPWVGGSGTH